MSIFPFIQTTFWLSISSKMQMPIADAKHHVKDMYTRILKNDLLTTDINDDYLEAVELYSENKHLLDD